VLSGGQIPRRPLRRPRLAPHVFADKEYELNEGIIQMTTNMAMPMRSTSEFGFSAGPTIWLRLQSWIHISGSSIDASLSTDHSNAKSFSF